MSDLAKNVRDLLFGVRRSSRYHQSRRGFFDRLKSVIDGLAVFCGVLAIYQVVSPEINMFLAIFLISCTTIAPLVARITGIEIKARKHHSLAKDFIDLETQILTHIKTATQENYGQWVAQRNSIQKREPSVKDVLNIMMHNKVVLGTGKGTLYNVKRHQRFLAQLMDVNPDDIGKADDSKQLKTAQ